MLPPSILRHRRFVILGAHAALAMFAYSAAFGLRFEGRPPAAALATLVQTIGLLVIIRLTVFALFGLHRGFWKHFGVDDLLRLVRGVTAGSAVFLALLVAVRSLGDVPLSVIVLDWMIMVLCVSGERLAVRYTLEGRLSRLASRRSGGKRVLVIGAGEAGERLLRQLRHDTESVLSVVALVDDDYGKLGRQLHGVPVVSTIDHLEHVVRREQIELVVIAISRASPDQMRRIVEQCLRAKVEFKRLPSMRDMLETGVRTGALADVRLEHLLVREPVSFDEQRVAKDLSGSVVLITGGAGSVGSELARQIARAKPSKLVLVDQAESALYYVDLELKAAHPQVEVIPVIRDITDRAAMNRVFAQFRPAHVYHAAAYKHVPLLECNPREAARNNVLGTLNVALAAARWGARKFVLISTDKAVRPSSVMGASKRVSERIVLGWPALQASGMEMRAVRFGNVLGSDGSVVPLFRRQLAAGGPLTVTHRDARRYFMTITEAAQLVLHAAAFPDAAGRITMLDMGEPIRILDLAENLVRLSGLEPYRDVQIVFTGLRPGEKLDEELMSSVERAVPTSMEKLSVVETDEVDGAEVQQCVERLIEAADRDDTTALLASLRELVPECVAPLRGMVVASSDDMSVPRERAVRPIAGLATAH